MSKCTKSTNGLHSFINTIPRDEHIAVYLTCIACGERRAIDATGQLIAWINERWEKIRPGNDGVKKHSKDQN